MKKSLIIGSARYEIVNYVDELPKGNEDISVLKTEERIGGSGYLCASVLHSFDFPYVLCAPVGTGTYGEFVHDKAESQGIELDCQSSQINGCTYILMDRHGQSSYMSVPGAEYDFEREYLEDLDIDDISKVIIFSEMLNDACGLEILDAVHMMDKPAVIVFNNDLSELSDEIRHAMMNLMPELILTDTDLYYLLDEKQMSLDKGCEKIVRITEEPVFVLKEGLGCYGTDKEESRLYSCSYPLNAGLFASFMICADMAGLDTAKAVSWSLESMHACGQGMDEDIMSLRRRRLAEVISSQ